MAKRRATKTDFDPYREWLGIPEDIRQQVGQIVRSLAGESHQQIAHVGKENRQRQDHPWDQGETRREERRLNTDAGTQNQVKPNNEPHRICFNRPRSPVSIYGRCADEFIQ